LYIPHFGKTNPILCWHLKGLLDCYDEYCVFEAQQLFDMPGMYAAIFAAGALGYTLNLLFLLIERRFVHWAGR
jgi:hypothetical protein